MFYGRGAGKLPTASAVVADVVDEARHLHRNIMTFWSSHKLALTDISNSQRAFFVRVKGEKEADEARVKEIFGRVSFIQVEDLPGEYGFTTGIMTEAEYEARAERLGNVISRIRIRHQKNTCRIEEI